MSHNALCTSPPRAAVPDQLIVARDYAWLYQTMREVAHGSFTVIVDRRHAERRQCVQPVLEERRRGERRSPLAITARSRWWQLCWSTNAPARRATARRAPGAD